jgi:protein-disulfide isomerase
MKRRLAIFVLPLLVVLVGLTVVVRSVASTEWEIRNTLQLESPPVDVAVSANGRWVFVLTDKGEVVIYSADGELKDRIAVGNHMDGIEAGPKEDILFLTSREKKTVQQIALHLAYDINVSDSPFKGPAEAPVVIAVFNDFQCPYCAKLLPLYQQVLEKYPKEVKLVFKHFPLRNHRFAGRAAMAAIAADRQGKFWPFHDQLFENFNKLSNQKIQEIAGRLDLNKEQFEKDMNDPKVAAKISQDLQDARKVGVRGTPAIFVNGKPLRQKSWEGFRAIIEKELEKIARENG